MEGLDRILQKLDPSVPVSITESCGDLLLQDLIEMFQEDAVMERTNLIASSVTFEKPWKETSSITIIPTPINTSSSSSSGHKKVSKDLQEYFQQMDEKKVRLYRRIVRCILFPAIQTKSNTSKSTKVFMANDPTFKEFVINHVILNYRNGLGISNWMKTVDKRFGGLSKVSSLQASLKTLIMTPNTTSFNVSSFLSVPKTKLGLMRSSTSALPGPDQNQRLYSDDQGNDMKLQKEEASLYLEDIKKFLQVQIELMTPKREKLELPIPEIRSKLSEFLDQFLDLVIKWMEKDYVRGKISGPEKDDKICFILLGVDKKSIPYQRQQRETPASAISINDDILKELQLIHPNMHDEIVEIEKSTSSYETVLFDLQLTISSRELLPFYETGTIIPFIHID
jgi:hypothetical protein